MAKDRPRLGYHFAKLHRLMIAISKKEINKMAIQSSQIPSIAELLPNDISATQDEIFTALVIDKAATAWALDQFQKDGFVFYEVHPENR